MPVKILMPALSPTMTEGKLANWLKSEGDMIASGDVIAEIETDKATMEVEAADEGKLVKIVVPEGTEGVAVNSLIAVLVEEGEEEGDLDAFIAEAQSAPATASKEETSQQQQPSAQPVAASAGAPAAPIAPVSPALQSSGPSLMAIASGAESSKRIFVSPIARRIAGNAGIALANVQGTGPHGRIIKADIEAILRSGVNQPVAANAPAAAPAAPSGPDAKELADMLDMAYTELPNDTVRKTIAKRLLESKQTVPHFYLSVDCELDALLAARKELNAKGDGEYKVSVNDYIVKAVAKALRDVPAANTSWTEAAILQYENVDVSVAVATDGGLITPIVKEADTKSLVDISSEVKDLATRAREGKLKPHEFQGGNFSISNLGMYGIKNFSAIVNPPQSCILAVGSGEQRAVIKGGEVKVATVMSVTLSCDHRSVDGAVGAEFLAAFKSAIEKPEELEAA